MGQHDTKFYLNKNSKYSSIVGGILSLVLYIVISFLILYSFWEFFTNITYNMSQTNTLIDNWKHKDITFKELIDYGFPLPKFTFENYQYYRSEEFEANGLKSIDGRDQNINKDFLSLVPEINKILN